MKTFILLVFVSLPVFSAECRLTGTLESSQKLETTLGAENFEACKILGSKTLGENFFGLASSEDKLVETKISFKGKQGHLTEVITSDLSD